jgi:hypothetical protein
VRTTIRLPRSDPRLMHHLEHDLSAPALLLLLLRWY